MRAKKAKAAGFASRPSLYPPFLIVPHSEHTHLILVVEQQFTTTIAYNFHPQLADDNAALMFHRPFLIHVPCLL